MPRRAFQEGIQGKIVVKAEMVLRNNSIEDVKLSGPKIFHANVRKAISLSKCRYEDAEVKFETDFVFNLLDEESPQGSQKSTESRSGTYKCVLP